MFMKLDIGVHVLAVPNSDVCSITELFPKELSGSTVELLDKTGNWTSLEIVEFKNNQLNASDVYLAIPAFSTLRLNLKRPIKLTWIVDFKPNSAVQAHELTFAEGFDLNEALYLAQLSQLIYQDEPTIMQNIQKNFDFSDYYFYSKASHKKFSKHNFQALLFAFLLGKKSILDLQFMYLNKVDQVTGKNLIVIVFRGSQEPEDWMTNFSLKDVDFLKRGRVHQGFFQAFKLFFRTLKRNSKKDDNAIPFGIFDDVEAFNSTSNIILTGHSLGGALATLAGCYLAELGIKKENIEVYSFGAPPAGSREFSEYYEKSLSVFRLVNENDVVPKLDKLTSLCHFGKEITLPSNQGEVHACGGYVDNIIDQIELVSS